MKTLLLLVFLGLDVAAPTNDDKIVGGDECRKHAAPWIVYFCVGYHVCTVSQIHPRWVVSAAHCYNSPIKVRLQEHDFTATEGSERLIKSEMVIRHPKYHYYTRYNDIMLIKLPASMNGNVVAVPLPTQCARTGDRCLISGWSRGKGPADRGYLFQCLDSPLRSDADCRGSYPRMFTDNNMCLGYLEGGRYHCEANSGGPVVCNGVLQGLVPWGFRCGVRGDLGIYTRVCKYVSWIDNIIAAN